MKISKLNLGLAMAAKGLNFVGLSEVSGISRTTLSAVNNGKTCRPSMLYRIAKVLEIDPKELLEREA